MEVKYSFVVLLFSACTTAKLSNRFEVTNRHVARGTHLALASDGAETGRIAEEIYKKGGNWADVFVASSFAISVEKPQSTGIGGGGFALVHIAAEGRTYAFDFRESAPTLLVAKYQELLAANGKRDLELLEKTIKGAGVPGIVAGLYRIHSKWGKLSWKETVEPAVRLASNGFAVDPLLAKAIEAIKTKGEMDAEFKKIFSKEGIPLKEGDLLKQEDLAKTLQLIADTGREDFYRGSISRKISEYSQSKGAFLRENDFANYEALEREPLKWSDANYEFVAFPFPSFGGEATQIIQSNQNLRKKLPPEQLIKEWVTTLHKTFEYRARKYEDNMEKPQTTHISLIDGEGNAISSTQTINSNFGAAKIIPTTGIILNDEMDDFYFENSTSLNHPTQSSRPLSSMSPTLVLENKKVKLAIGSMSGRRIISCVNWVLLNYLWQNHSLEEATSSPRVHLAYPKRTLVADVTTPESWLKSLAGYKIEAPTTDCRNQSVEYNAGTGELKAVVDPRSTGTPFAF